MFPHITVTLAVFFLMLDKYDQENSNTFNIKMQLIWIAPIRLYIMQIANNIALNYSILLTDLKESLLVIVASRAIVLVVLMLCYWMVLRQWCPINSINSLISLKIIWECWLLQINLAYWHNLDVFFLINKLKAYH